MLESDNSHTLNSSESNIFTIESQKEIIFDQDPATESGHQIKTSNDLPQTNAEAAYESEINESVEKVKINDERIIKIIQELALNKNAAIFKKNLLYPLLGSLCILVVVGIPTALIPQHDVFKVFSYYPGSQSDKYVTKMH